MIGNYIGNGIVLTVTVLMCCLIACSKENRPTVWEKANTPYIDYSAGVDYVQYREIADSIMAEYPSLLHMTFNARYDYSSVKKIDPEVSYTVDIPAQKFLYQKGEFVKNKEVQFIEKIRDRFRASQIYTFMKSETNVAINIKPNLIINFFDPSHRSYVSNTNAYDRVISGGGQDPRGDYYYKLADGVYLKTERR